MQSRLTWSALILAALASVANWSPESDPACDESRPVFGAGACCEGHRVAGATALAVEAARSASVGPLARR